MSDAEHSPWPWAWAYVGSGDWHIDDARGQYVASVSSRIREEGEPRDEGADARLIAAAPELLEALGAALDKWPDGMDHSDHERARELVDRVRGKR
ncbi:MAG TPA: hypothetical protein VFB66_01820 [Tepidisphaeraceae bacterium]|nr:hypothetical protein [Tepidisphaeraceae bacterium]